MLEPQDMFRATGFFALPSGYVPRISLNLVADVLTPNI